MSRHWVLMVIGFSAVVAIAGVWALAQPASTRPARAIRPLPGNLHRDMEVMGDAFEMLEAQIADSSKNASSLDIIARMQQLTVGVKQLTPQTVQRLPQAERPAKVLEYRNMMLNLLRAELDVEEHLLAGDNSKAAEALGRMKELQDQGHEDFRPEKGEATRRPHGPTG